MARLVRTDSGQHPPSSDSHRRCHNRYLLASSLPMRAGLGRCQAVAWMATIQSDPAALMPTCMPHLALPSPTRRVPCMPNHDIFESLFLHLSLSIYTMSIRLPPHSLNHHHRLRSIASLVCLCLLLFCYPLFSSSFHFYVPLSLSFHPLHVSQSSSSTHLSISLLISRSHLIALYLSFGLFCLAATWCCIT